MEVREGTAHAQSGILKEVSTCVSLPPPQESGRRGCHSSGVPPGRACSGNFGGSEILAVCVHCLGIGASILRLLESIVMVE